MLRMGHAWKSTRLRAVAAGALSLAATGCISVKPGDIVLHVDVEDEAEAKQIRRELWRVQRAISEVQVHYGLQDIAIEVVVTDLGGLGETSPALEGLSVHGAKFALNKHVLIDGHPDIDAIIYGLTAHELAHALHYARMHPNDLVTLGIRYDRMMKNPEARITTGSRRTSNSRT